MNSINILNHEKLIAETTHDSTAVTDSTGFFITWEVTITEPEIDWSQLWAVQIPYFEDFL